MDMLIAIVLNACLLAMELVAIISSLRRYSWGQCRYFTFDSNLLCLLSSLAWLALALRGIAGGRPFWPIWLGILKYLSVTCLSLTFLVALFILTPMAGKGGFASLFLSGSLVFQHLLCPLLAFVSFVFFEPKLELGPLALFLAWLPSLVYAAILIALNLARVIEGPYPFLKVYSQRLILSVAYLVLILGGSLGLAWGILRLYTLG